MNASILTAAAAKAAAGRIATRDDGLTIPQPPLPWDRVQPLTTGWTGPGLPAPTDTRELQATNRLNNARRAVAQASAELAAVNLCRDAEWRDIERPGRRRALEKAEIEFEVARTELRLVQARLAGLTVPALAAE